MKKILMVAPFETNGRYKGGISFVANTIAESKDLLNKNDLSIQTLNTCLHRRQENNGAKVNFDNILNFLKLSKAALKQTKEVKPDIIYYHTSVKIALLKDMMIVHKLKRKTTAKIIVHIHFADYEKIMTGKEIVDKFILNGLKKDADHVIFLSERTMDAYIGRGILKNKCSVIYNFSVLNISKTEIVQKVSRNDNILRLLFVGSIDKRKGLFDVFEVLKRHSNSIILNVCGGFNGEEEKKSFFEYKEELGDMVKFHGYVSGEAKKKIFSESDVLVLPSYGEGLPIVILEAMSAGCAIISSNVGAIPEIISDENGCLVESGDLKALDKAITYYAANNKKLREQQMNNYNLSNEYSLGGFVKKLAAICERLK